MSIILYEWTLEECIFWGLFSAAAKCDTMVSVAGQQQTVCVGVCQDDSWISSLC